MKLHLPAHSLLLLLTLCFWTGLAGDARAQDKGAVPEIVLRSGASMRAQPAIDVASAEIRLDGRAKTLERGEVSVICFSPRAGAPPESVERDLVVTKDGRRVSGDIVSMDASDVRLVSETDTIAIGEIAYIKLADNVFYSLEQALRAPATARRLILNASSPARRLSPDIGKLVNLTELQISCHEQLSDLPVQIGNLQKLERLIIDNGNGCDMDVSIPSSIGRLGNLKVLNLYGALVLGRVPNTLGDLRSLEELNLGSNGLESVPSAVASLQNLKVLSLDCNALTAVPSFVGGLKNLRELWVEHNNRITLPPELASLKGLTVHLGNNSLTLTQQKALRARFPDLILDFEDDIDDGTVNEREPEPRPGPSRE